MSPLSIAMLPVFLAAETVEACRYCGVRTDFEELDDGDQVHHCPQCGASYLLTEDEEE